MQISDFLVDKYKSSIMFRSFSRKTLGSVPFSKDGRVTANTHIFWPNYNITSLACLTHHKMFGNRLWMHPRTNKYRIEKFRWSRVTSSRPYYDKFLESFSTPHSFIKTPLQLNFQNKVYFCLVSFFFILIYILLLKNWYIFC